MTVRAKKCVWCKKPFLPKRMGQRVCSMDCACQIARRQREKTERALDSARRAALKTRQQWLQDAQSAFNRWVRERDKELPCISCGRFVQKYDAGHYRSVGAAGHLRFNEDNVHKQCSQCNQHLSGNIVAYRQGLIARIGVERVEALENDHGVRRWSIEEAMAIRSTYRKKFRQLIAQAGDETAKKKAELNALLWRNSPNALKGRMRARVFAVIQAAPRPLSGWEVACAVRLPYKPVVDSLCALYNQGKIDRLSKKRATRWWVLPLPAAGVAVLNQWLRTVMGARPESN